MEKRVQIIEPTISRMAGQDNQPGVRKLRVAAYARVSTEQDEQQSSYEAQVSYYTSFIKANPDWEFAGIYADEGITGTNTKHREGFNSMIEAAMSGQIDLILTKSISRFARNTVDTLQTVRKLKEKGVEVRFEKENLHTFDPKCEVMLTILSSLAQEESRSISENVRWGKHKSMQDGNFSLGYSRFLGYKRGKDGRPEIVPEEAETVRRIYQMYLEGQSYNQIARTLTAEKIPTPGGKEVWRTTTVRSILTNEKYAGLALLQKTYTADYLTKKVKKNQGEVRQYLVENSHEAIIPRETFERVQRMIAGEEHRQKYSKNPFAGKLICADCGKAFGHKVWNSRERIKYDIWQCNHKYTGERCSTPALREEKIKEAFMIAMKNRGENPGFEFSVYLWREQVEKVIVFANRLEFHFLDGSIENITF